jgi:hypothetical protein
MKAINRIIVGLAVGCVITLGLAVNIQAQNQKSPPGTYYSAKDPDLVPYPFNPHPELPVTEISPGHFVVDDTGIPDTPQQEISRKIRRAAAEKAKQIASDPVLSAAAQAAQQAAQQAAEAERFQTDFAPFLADDLRNSEGTPVDAVESMAEQNALLLDSAAAAADAYTVNYSNALASVQSQGFSLTVTNENGVNGFLYGWNLGGATYVSMHNAVAADTISTDEVRPGGSTGLGLTGTNQIIGLWDGGDVRLTHQEFTNGGVRVFDMDGTSANGQQWHSTHVSGTLAAKGVVAASRGMAYEARVNAYDIALDTSEMRGAAATNALHVSNHSYGIFAGWGGFEASTGYPIWWGELLLGTTEDWQFGFYTGDSQNVDTTAYLAPYYLTVWSAGNDRGEPGPASQPTLHWCRYNGAFNVYTPLHTHPGDGGATGYDTVSAQETAKDGLVVGAVSDIVGGYSGSNSVSVTAFSSWGPTDDGRIKPDIAANGELLFSTTNSSDAAYASSSGTSMASPSVAGSVALLLQLHDQLHGTNQPWLSSTWKGVLLNTADEAGTAAGPDYKSGWGLMNTARAALLVRSNFVAGGVSHIKETVLQNTNSIEFTVTATGTNQLKVMTVWIDPPATPLAFASIDPTNLMLINDLDVRVIRSGVTNFPWVLNPASPTNAATTGDNFRDNVEQVIINNPVTNGVYTVRITHKGTLTDGSNNTTNQRVSIVLSGIVPQAEPALQITDMMMLAGSPVVKWDSVVGRFYRVEARNDLASGSWTAVSGEVAATKSQTAFTVTASGDSQRFFRIVRVR